MENISKIEASHLFELDNISFLVDNSIILKGITTTLNSGKITGVIGPSGAGKSTFLRLMNRLITPTTGKIYYKGRNYDQLDPRQIRKEIGLVQQQPNLFSGSVKHNLLYGPKVWNIQYSENELIALLERVNLDDSFLERDVATLSGGEKQRVNVARSLANQPNTLLLDEPTSSLDISSAEILEATIKNLAKEGIKIIIVTHSLEQTKKLTDEILFFKDQQLNEKIPTKEFFEKYDETQILSFFQKNQGDKK